MPSTTFSITDGTVRAKIVTLALLCAGCAPADDAEPVVPESSLASVEQAFDTTTIDIRGPTLLAHFPITQPQIDSSADVAEVLSDFQYHLDGARDSLKRLGLTVQERYTPVVHYRLSGRVVRFAPPRDSAVAYVFVAPDRPTRVHYGVVTNIELVELATHFLAVRSDP
jgi:hypothetical protein